MVETKKTATIHELQEKYETLAKKNKGNIDLNIHWLMWQISSRVLTIVHTTNNEEEREGPLLDVLDYFEDKFGTNIWLLKVLKQYVDELSTALTLEKKNKKSTPRKKQAEKIKSIELSEDEVLEKKYILELLWLFDNNDDILLVKSTINHIYRHIRSTIMADISDAKKDAALKNTLWIVDLSYIKNNEKAKSLLNIIIWIKIKQLTQKKKEEFHITSKIPEKSSHLVMWILKKVVSIDYSYKEKCELFIEKLDEQIPNLLQTIEKNQNPWIFKAEYIIPILLELDIPINLHNYFLEIVDIYFEDKKHTLLNVTINDLYYSEAILYLKKALSECEKKYLNECETFVIYLQQKFIPWLAAEIIAKEREIEREEKQTKTSDVVSIIWKMHQRSIWTKQVPKNVNEYLQKSTLNIKSNVDTRHPFLIEKSKLSPIERAFDRSVNEVFEVFPYIPDKTKKSLKPFIKCYLNFIKTLSKKDLWVIEKFFESARKI